MRQLVLLLFSVSGLSCAPSTQSAPPGGVAVEPAVAGPPATSTIQDVGPQGEPAQGVVAEQGGRAAPPPETADVLATPPWEHTVFSPLPKSDPVTPLRLKKVEMKRNRVTDDEAWFAEVDWEPPVVFGFGSAHPSAVPGWLPETHAGAKLFRAWRSDGSGDRFIAIYGDDPEYTRIVVVFEPTGQVVRAFDLSNFTTAPVTKPGDQAYVTQELSWAVTDGETLFMSHAHRTYAESSGGQNAYITAVDLVTGEMRWRSAALVANASTFVVTKDHLITGYGFTAEPDFVYVLRRHDGTVESRVKVKSGPSYIFLRDDRLFVRTYDTNYQFTVSGLAR